MQASIAHMNDNFLPIPAISLEEFTSAVQVMAGYLNAPHDTAQVREVLQSIDVNVMSQPEPLYMIYDVKRGGWLYRLKGGERVFYMPRGEALTTANQINATRKKDFCIPVSAEDYQASYGGNDAAITN